MKTVPVSTVGETFAHFDNVVVVDGLGGANAKDGTYRATTYTRFLPEHLASNAREVRDRFNARWISKGWEDKSESEKLAMWDKFVSEFSPSEPRSATPLDLAIAEILQQLNPGKVNQSLSGNALVAATEKQIEVFKVRASLEKYRNQIEARVASILAATKLRGVKGASGATDDDDFDYGTDDEETNSEAAN